MKRLAVAVLCAVGISYVAHAASVQAYQVDQWIAPEECVIDAGLPTQHILSEAECYELLHPSQPGTEDPETSVNEWLTIPKNPYVTHKNQPPLLPEMGAVGSIKISPRDFYGTSERGSLAVGLTALLIYFIALGLLYRYYRELDE